MPTMYSVKQPEFALFFSQEHVRQILQNIAKQNIPAKVIITGTTNLPAQVLQDDTFVAKFSVCTPSGKHIADYQYKVKENLINAGAANLELRGIQSIFLTAKDAATVLMKYALDSRQTKTLLGYQQDNSHGILLLGELV